MTAEHDYNLYKLPRVYVRTCLNVMYSAVLVLQIQVESVGNFMAHPGHVFVVDTESETYLL